MPLITVETDWVLNADFVGVLVLICPGHCLTGEKTKQSFLLCFYSQYILTKITKLDSITVSLIINTQRVLYRNCRVAYV